MRQVRAILDYCRQANLWPRSPYGNVATLTLVAASGTALGVGLYSVFGTVVQAVVIAVVQTVATTLATTHLVQRDVRMRQVTADRIAIQCASVVDALCQDYLEVRSHASMAVSDPFAAEVADVLKGWRSSAPEEERFRVGYSDLGPWIASHLNLGSIIKATVEQLREIGQTIDVARGVLPMGSPHVADQVMVIHDRWVGESMPDSLVDLERGSRGWERLCLLACMRDPGRDVSREVSESICAVARAIECLGADVGGIVSNFRKDTLEPFRQKLLSSERAWWDEACEDSPETGAAGMTK